MGKTLWSADTANHNYVDPESHTAGLRDSDDWLGYDRELDVLLSGKTFETYAFHAAGGKPLWHEAVGTPPVILCGDKLLTQQGQFYRHADRQASGRGIGYGRHGCNYAVANQYLIMVRDGSASYVNISTGKETSLFAVRSGCSNSLIAADGLLNAPCYSVGCVCNYPMQTSFALVPTPPAARQVGIREFLVCLHSMGHRSAKGCGLPNTPPIYSTCVCAASLDAPPSGPVQLPSRRSGDYRRVGLARARFVA